MAVAVLSGAAQPEPRHAPCVAPAFAAGRQGSGGSWDRFVFVLVNVWADNSTRFVHYHFRTSWTCTLELKCFLLEIRPRRPLFISFFPNTSVFCRNFCAEPRPRPSPHRVVTGP